MRNCVPNESVAEGAFDIFKKLPPSGSTVKIAGRPVEISYGSHGGEDNSHVNFSWNDTNGKEHYVEARVETITNLRALAKRIKSEMDWVEQQNAKQGVAEGAKVDRMVQHIKSSEKKAGKSAKDAESIAWATANKRGMLDNKNKKKVSEAERNEMDTPAVQAALKNMSDRHKNEKWSKEQLAALGKRLAAQDKNKKGVDETVSTHKGGKITKTPTGIKHQAAPGNYGGYEPELDHLQTLDKSETGRIERSMDIKHKRKKAWQGGIDLDEAVTKEDIITKLNAKLGDYLSNIGQQIKNDPTLQNKLTAKTPGDQVGPPVKTVTTDDGHEIQIHGNEDDGFRISVKNKQTPSKFDNLDEAVMACEMYCAHRRRQALNSDYIDEA